MKCEKVHDAPGQNKEFNIIVNGRPMVFSKKKISFIEVVELAFNTTEINKNICYTVAYRKGEGKKKEGIMVEGDVIPVKEGMIFDVTQTDKS